MRFIATVFRLPLHERKIWRRTPHLLVLALTLILAGSLAAQDPGTTDLTHRWTFDDGTANDAVGGAHGTLVGGAQVVNGALLTTAVGDWLQLDGALIAMFTYDQVSLEGWFTPDSARNTGFHMLAFFGDSKVPEGGTAAYGSNSFFFSPARGDNKCRAAISIGQENNPWEVESGADGIEVDDGQLHHFVATIDGVFITLYLDGALAVPPTGQAQGPTPLSATNGIFGISPNFTGLAKGGYQNDPEWLGQIHEFSIYNRALTEDEAVWLYENTMPVTAVQEKDSPKLPTEFSLAQNYPNPFNPTTNITFTVIQREKVKLTVHNLLGNEVATLLNETWNPGEYTVTFNASGLSSGIYYYRLQSRSGTITRKMILMR